MGKKKKGGKKLKKMKKILNLNNKKGQLISFYKQEPMKQDKDEGEKNHQEKRNKRNMFTEHFTFDISK